MTFFRIPFCYLGVTESELDQVVGVPVRGGEGPGTLVSDFLSSLAAKAEFRRSTIGDRLSRTAVHLLSVLVMELLETSTADEAADGSRGGDAVPDPGLYRRASDGPGPLTGVDRTCPPHLRPVSAQAASSTTASR